MPRPRGQRGQIKHHGANWIFVYYVGSKRTHTVLAPFALYPFRNPEQVREKFTDKINELLRPVNAEVPSAAMMDGLLTVEKYINDVYWKRCEQRQQLEGANHMEPSTIHGYRKIFSKHVQGKPVGSIQIGRFTAKDGQDWLDSLPQNLSHKTHMRVRAFLSGVLTTALQSGVITGVNPMDATKAGGKSKGRKESELTARELKIRKSNEHAYEHAEIALMLDKLPEPARTVCAVAAFTGLTRSEIPALKWEDYKNGEIHVSRKKWRDHIGEPKTEAREAAVPVAPLLQEILAKYKTKDFPPVDDNWMFYGQKEKKPIDMDNLSRRDIPQFINGAWFGWHAFRRGLGTRLSDMGVAATDIQSILRHANISTTQGYYIFPNQDKAKAGLKKLTETVRKKYGIKA
ncbi:MAG TPA: tyrosine-type recombinase/integrase [Candidatus Acidoferrum sp.]